MADTLAEQLRVAIVADSVAKFRLEMQVTDPGDLPDSEVFLFRIGTASDPKTDELERVISIGDFTRWQVRRPEALRQGDLFYRTASVIKTYDELEAAITAKDFLAEKVNELVELYQKFVTEFQSDPPELFAFPTPSTGVLAPLIADYQAKTEEVEAQETLLSDKTEECDAADDAYQAALNARDTAQASLDGLLRGQTALQTALTSMNTFATVATDLGVEVVEALDEWAAQRGTMSPAAEVQAMDDHMLADPPGPAGTLWEEYYNEYAPAAVVFAQDRQTLTAEESVFGNAVLAAQNALNESQNDLDDALQAKETCEAEKTTLSAVLDTLKQQQAALLQEIVDLCPTFTPT